MMCPKIYINEKVFGESILNDAVSIVLCNIMIKLGKDTTDAGFGVLLSALVEFSQLMVLSAFLGIFSALVCALVLKHIDLRRNPSLEFGMMLAFSYFPYCCAEALDLSGITSILFAGIVMSHYAHQNLSLVTQEWTLYCIVGSSFLDQNWTPSYIIYIT